jgi:glycerol-3-phosphate dehydrogenase
VFEFSQRTRQTALERLGDTPLDVLVVGGGATGCGVALDAATRGLSTGLVEREDFASGTSGRSSRLIHGGLRYLQHGDLRVVYESLFEREVLRKLAPHLVRPLANFVPAVKPQHRIPLRVGLLIYETMAWGRNIRRHRVVGPEEGARFAPGLARASGGIVYYDCRTDDARLTLENARAAAHAGALVANHATVEAIERWTEGFRVTVRDTRSDATSHVFAKLVVNAGGVWAARVQGLAESTPVHLQPSKGVHLVFRAEDLPINAAVGLRSGAHDGRFVFLIPWGPRVYVGTTDTPYAGELEDPTVDEDDREYILRGVNRAFGTSLTFEDTTASWAGLRPLLEHAGSEATRDISRRHVILEDPPGLITVTGGKLTTYRKMAEDVTDRACELLDIHVRSRTRTAPLGLTRPFLTEMGRAASEAERLGLDPDAGRRMVERFGDDWTEALRRVREDHALGEPLVDGLPVLRVEASLARDREMALTDDDVLVRRTRLTTMDEKAAAAVRL